MKVVFSATYFILAQHFPFQETVNVCMHILLCKPTFSAARLDIRDMSNQYQFICKS